jgi:hypothetical protein
MDLPAPGTLSAPRHQLALPHTLATATVKQQKEQAMPVPNINNVVLTGQLVRDPDLREAGVLRRPRRSGRGLNRPRPPQRVNFYGVLFFEFGFATEFEGRCAFDAHAEITDTKFRRFPGAGFTEFQREGFFAFKVGQPFPDV